MTFKESLQQQSTLKEKILAVLIVLTETHGLGQMEICRRLGYSNDVLSRVKSDEKYQGSRQLLAGLLLLKELTELKLAKGAAAPGSYPKPEETTALREEPSSALEKKIWAKIRSEVRKMVEEDQHQIHE